MSVNSSLQKTIYRPAKYAIGIWAVGKMFHDLSSARFLGFQLFKRDTQAMFRQSFLGLIWAFIPPFFTAAVWIFINFFGFVKISNTGDNYAIFVMCGTVIFQAFFEALKISSDTVNSGKGMMGKLKFPREAFLISAFYKLLFNFTMRVIALVVIALFLRHHFTWNSLLFLPASMVVLFIGFGVGILLIPFQMLYEDFGRLLGIGSSVLMYLTPVVFPIPAEGIFRKLFLSNPLTPCVTVTRDLFMGSSPTMWLYFFSLFFISLPIIWVGWALFRVTMPIIIERTGA